MLYCTVYRRDLHLWSCATDEILRVTQPTAIAGVNRTTSGRVGTVTETLHDHAQPAARA